MGFNWRSPIVSRIGVLAGTIVALCFIGFVRGEWVVTVILVAFTIYQVKLLVEYVERSNTNVTSFLDTIQFDDLSYSVKTYSDDPAVQRICAQVNEAMTKLRNSRRSRDSEFLFFKNIVMHVGIGLIVFREDGKIEIFNAAARKLLKTTQPENIRDLSHVSQQLVNVFLKLKTGGRELVRLKLSEELVQLSMYAIELTLRGENVKLISIQNIQSELEEKEMEAWQNLVRVLTHEIMNSVTPISSLAGTVEKELKQYIDKGESLPQEQWLDTHLSLQTISKRSEGLIHFVKEFRNLSNIPQPRPVTIEVKNILEEITLLHKRELTEHGITVTIDVYPEDLTISADKNLIEQVLINLVKNAIQAFDEQPDKQIELRGSVSEKYRPVISVKDNGQGIDPDALEKIFIPFFTTKKHGSGIGLSLSRQIMRKHHGTLSVKSSTANGTEFLLRF
jgi:two-component system nitrogen regulation sensor histidine kinase NtrY